MGALYTKKPHRNNSIVDIIATTWHISAPKNWKTMKDLITKIIHTFAATLISCIVVYGMVYAQQVCCSTIVDACIPTFNRISDSYIIDNCCRTSPSHNRDNQLQSNFCSESIIADFGSDNTCCETDRCDGYNQVTELGLSFIQDFYPLQKTLSSFDAGSGAQTTTPSNKRSTFHKVVPIYILTESIIC